MICKSRSIICWPITICIAKENIPIDALIALTLHYCLATEINEIVTIYIFIMKTNLDPYFKLVSE